MEQSTCVSIYLSKKHFYNWHILLILFYIYFLNLRIADPTNTKPVLETILFLVTMGCGAAFSVDNASVPCLYLSREEMTNYHQQQTLHMYSIVISFWSVLALPIIIFLRNLIDR